MKYEYKYDASGNIIDLKLKNNSNIVLAYEYLYDKEKRIISKSEIGIGSEQKQYSYDYNSIGQLLNSKLITGASKEEKTIYEYDKYGNISKVKYIKNESIDNKLKMSGYEERKEYNQNNMLKSRIKLNYQDETERKKKARLDVYSYNYDLNGNLLSILENDKTNEILGYDVFNRLISYENINENKKATYGYYPNDLRAYKKLGEEKIEYYHGINKMLLMEKTNGKTAYNFFAVGGIVGRIDYDKNFRYMYKNEHHDIVMEMDVNGNNKIEYEYDDYGKLKNGVVSNNPFRYTGEYYDEESGYYYLRARYYSPEIRRFINEDTYKGDIKEPLSLNYYAYCAGNPIMYVDPTGHEPEKKQSNWFGKWLKNMTKMTLHAVDEESAIPTIYNAEILGTDIQNYVEEEIAWSAGGYGAGKAAMVIGSTGGKFLKHADEIDDVAKGAKKLLKNTDEIAYFSKKGYGNVNKKAMKQLEKKFNKKQIAQMLSKIENGFVGKEGQQGIKRLSGNGIDNCMYELKVKGELGDYRLIGNLNDDGKVIFEKLIRHE